MDAKTRRRARVRRHVRVRRKISGTAERPRLAVYRSNRHIYAQLVDDEAARTLVAASDREVQVSGAGKAGGTGKAGGAGKAGGDGKTAPSKAVGELLAERAQIVGVVTQPDKPQGRSRSTLIPPPVKDVAVPNSSSPT